MSIISRSEFLAKANLALHQGLKLLVGKEIGKGGGGRPIVFLKDDKLEWYINTLKIDSTHRFGNVENLLHRDGTGRIVSIDSSLLEKVIAPSYSSSNYTSKIATVIETEKRKPGRPKAVKTEVVAEEAVNTEKRKPGRPKAVKTEVVAEEAVNTEKRKPGRPKAIKLDAPVEVISTEKRKPGRPKAVKLDVVPTEVVIAEKRKPGRPKAVKLDVVPAEVVIAEKRKPGRPKAAEITQDATIFSSNMNLTDFIELLNQMNKSTWKKAAVLAILNAKD